MPGAGPLLPGTSVPPVSSLRPVRGSAAEVVSALTVWLAAPAEPEPLLVETSGSTGAPKPVILSRRAILASVTATEQRLGARGRWVLALPVSYVAGLQVVSRSLVAGAPPVVLANHHSLGDAVAEASSAGPAFVSLVSTQLHRMLQVPDDLAGLQACHTVLLGGGPVPAELRRRAEDAGVRVVATYGSAETAGGCVYDGCPLDGVDVALGERGRIQVAGPVLFDGYHDDPALTSDVLVDGWFHTADAGRFDEDGRLQVLGRLDDIVLSGGVNVPAAVVAARLREHPDVTDVEVLGVSDPEWGQRLVAFVVGPLSLAEARDWVGAVHPRSWAPRQVVVLETIPVLENGKPDRVRLRERA